MKPAKVPNDVQREDQILLFITLKQLIMLLIGGGISYMLFTSLNKSYILNEFQQTLIWIPLGLSAMLAFLRIKGMTTLQVVLLFLEKIFRPSPRKWVQNGGTPFVSMTTSVVVSAQGKKNAEKKSLPAKEVSQKNIKNLATLIDGASHGETFKNI